jgi:hypothetical protein
MSYRENEFPLLALIKIPIDLDSFTIRSLAGCRGAPGNPGGGSICGHNLKHLVGAGKNVLRLRGAVKHLFKFFYYFFCMCLFAKVFAWRKRKDLRKKLSRGLAGH